MSNETIYKANDIELSYGMLDGELIHISEVKSGLAENCLCPKCGSFLVAKKGDIRKHHFAHYNFENCLGAQETAIHLLAKEILLQEKCVSLVSSATTDTHNLLRFNKLSIEVRGHGLVFDAVGYGEVNDLAIEIKVTHEVDSRKREIVVNNGIRMIEIDLSEFLSCEFTREEIKHAVINSAPRYLIEEIQPTIQTTEDKDMINKAYIAGFKLASGYSRKNNCNFESNKIFILQPVENRSSTNYQVAACGGYEILELNIVDSPTLIEKISSFSYPLEARLTVETAFQKTKCVPVVTDVNLI